MATVKERLDKHEQRLDKHDREIAAIRELIKAGMCLLAENQRVGLEVRKEMRALSAAQKRTEETLQAFIASMRRGGNGHGKGLALG